MKPPAGYIPLNEFFDKEAALLDRKNLCSVVVSPGVDLVSPLSITESFHKMALTNQARDSPIPQMVKCWIMVAL